MSARLSPLNQPNAPAFNLQRPVQLVGRHPECDIRIDQPKISRRHCCIALAYDRIVIRDLGSRNGIRLNGALVDEAQLRDGDELAIGPLLFLVHAPEEMKVPPSAPKPVDVLPILAEEESDNDLIALDF